MHPSRTPSGKMRLRDPDTGVVLERWAPDAHGMVSSGEYEFVPAGTPTTAEKLATMPRQELIELAAPHLSRPDPTGAALEDLRHRLLALIVAGEVRIP